METTMEISEKKFLELELTLLVKQTSRLEEELEQALKAAKK